MPRKSPYLTESVYESSQSDLRSLGRTGEVSRRLNAIISSYNNSISEVAKIYNTTNKTIRLWIKNYKDHGIEGLSTSKGRGRKPILSPSDIEKVSVILSKNSSITIDNLRQLIESDLGKKVGKSTCHNVMRQCGYSYKTARKKHYKSNPEEQSDFKKNSF